MPPSTASPNTSSGGTVGFYHHVVDGETAEQREFEKLDPAELPNLSRMIAEGRYAGFDAEFEFGLEAMVRGLLEVPRPRLEGLS